MGLRGRDMSADRGAQGHEEGQGRITVADPGRHVRHGARQGADIAVEQQVGEVAPPDKPQVHQGEGDVVEHVDPRQFLVEFDTVEQGRPPVEPADVAKVKIAVAKADEAGAGAGVEQVRPLPQFAAEGGVEPATLLLGENPAMGEGILVEVEEMGEDA